MNDQTYPRYARYKDSGVEWLGEIPEHWDVLSIRHLALLKSGESITSAEINSAGEYPVYGGNGLRGYTTAYTHDGHYVLIGRQGALCGNINYANGKFWASEHAVVVSPRVPFEPHWMGELLRAMNLNQYSLSAAQPGLSVAAISALKIPVPPLLEQGKIATFLNRETMRIDALIEKQERLIERLEENLKALITHAVTQGLNPNVRMKESGISWIGMVPDHWRIERARHLFRQVAIPPQEGDKVVTVFRDGQVTLRENRRTDGFTFAILELGYQHVRTGDLVIHSMDAFAGAIGVSDSDGKCTGEYVICEPTVLGLNNHYYADLLRWMAKQNYIYVICPSVRQRAPRFRFNTFREVRLPVPPGEEQDAIMAFLRHEREQISGLALKIGQLIEKLREKRTALISAAVTGKIRISGKQDVSRSQSVEK